jgi:hypothetical protein
LYQTRVISDIIPRTAFSFAESWTGIFESLYSPATHIFDALPVKYSLNDLTMRPEVRRILLPLNPAINDHYLKFWKTKYGTDPPNIRLTLKSVCRSVPLIPARDVSWTGDATILHGIDLIPGILAIDAETILFYRKTPPSMTAIPMSDIKAIHLTLFEHQARGIMVERKNGHSALFAFGHRSLRNAFLETIERHNVPVIREESVQDSTKKWLRGQLSNFDYLMDLNLKSGRSWSDYTQFPIFPWIIVDFKHKFNSFRDLQLPFFAQTQEQRTYCEDFYSSAEVNYPSFISNISTALYYLIRLEPVTTTEIDFQGGTLDLPARTFQSLQLTCEIMSSGRCRTVQELIPELFFLPESARNLNGIVFQSEITDIALPC